MKTKHRKKEQVTRIGGNIGAVTQNKISWESSAKTLLTVTMLIGGSERRGQADRPPCTRGEFACWGWTGSLIRSLHGETWAESAESVAALATLLTCGF